MAVAVCVLLACLFYETDSLVIDLKLTINCDRTKRAFDRITLSN